MIHLLLGPLMQQGAGGGSDAHTRVAAVIAANPGDFAAHWKMDDAAPNATMENSHGSLDGTYANDAAVTLGDIDGTPVAEFTGSAGTASVPDTSDALDAIVGYFFAAEITSVSASDDLLLKRSQNPNQVFSVARVGSGGNTDKIVFSDNGAFYGFAIYSTSTIANDTPFTVGICYSAAEDDYQLWINGVLNSSYNASAGPPFDGFNLTTNLPLVVGGGAFTGKIGSIVGLLDVDGGQIAALHDAWVGP